MRTASDRPKGVKRLLRNERGAVSVVVALSLTALFGFAAMALDFGLLAARRQSLQNAADAAALAAAADLGSRKTLSVITGTANDYCALNGFDPDAETVDMTLTITGRTVTVTLTDQVSMGFSAVLTGQYDRTVTAKASAEATSIFGSCPYAMFAGQRIEESGLGIAIGGNDIFINGNIHSNSSIRMQHAELGSGAVATAVSRDNRMPDAEGWNSGSIALDMPSFRSFEQALSGMTGVIQFGGNVTKSSKAGFQELIDEALSRYELEVGGTAYQTGGLYIRITGNLTFNGHASTIYTPSFPIVLVVDGNIDLNGAPITSTKDFPVAVMSKSGNITVNGGGARYVGILYAPKGDINLNGNDAEFVGSIVAQNIRKTGGKITVSYYENADRYLPTTKVHLIN